MKTTPKDRLIKYLKHKRLSMSNFAEQCGITKSILSRLSESTAQATLSKIESNSDINIEWLITGEGDMLSFNEVADDAHEKESKSKERLIPFYDVETTGGYNGVVSASEEGALSGYIQPGGWFDGRETAAIRHVGDSMVEYPNGCVLAVREVKEKRLLVPGRNYVIETREYRVTKRVQRGSHENTIMLYSSNEDKYDDGRLIHEPFEVGLEDVLHIYSVLGYIVNQSGEFRLIKP